MARGVSPLLCKVKLFTLNTMTRTKEDHHHAAAQGLRGQELLKIKFQDMGLPLITKKAECLQSNIPYEGTLKFSCVGDYVDSGFSFFMSDGFEPKTSTVVEFKYGTAQGTAEEKIFFDLLKIRDKCYGDRNLVYVFGGKKQQDHRTLLFVKKLSSLHQQGECLNAKVVMLDDLSKEMFVNLFNQ